MTSSTKHMTADHMDMYLAFVLREKRILKKRETSFSPAELFAAERQIRGVLKAVHAKLHKKEELDLVISRINKRRQLARDILRHCKGMTRKQVILVLDNFILFEDAMRKTAVPKIVLPDPSKGDAFYVPKKHNYR